MGLLNKKHLNDRSVATVRRGGYYTALAAPGLRVVALNTVLYYVDNEAVAQNHTTHDVGGQLAWLSEVLHAARVAGAKPTWRVTNSTFTPFAFIFSKSSLVKCKPAVGAAAEPSSLE